MAIYYKFNKHFVVTITLYNKLQALIICKIREANSNTRVDFC